MKTFILSITKPSEETSKTSRVRKTYSRVCNLNCGWYGKELLLYKTRLGYSVSINLKTEKTPNTHTNAHQPLGMQESRVLLPPSSLESYCYCFPVLISLALCH